MDFGEMFAKALDEQSATFNASAGLDAHLSSILGKNLMGDVAEISRRRLAAARRSVSDGIAGGGHPLVAAAIIENAEAEYRMFGGDPTKVGDDWVTARVVDQDGSFDGYYTVPVAEATRISAGTRSGFQWTCSKEVRDKYLL